MFYTISILDLAELMDLKACTNFLEVANSYDLDSRTDYFAII